MTNGDRQAFARMIFALGETFGEPVSDLRVEAYFDALGDLPLEDVLTAGRSAIREARFFPRPVELREQIDGKVEDQSEIAWTYVQREVRRVGFYGAPTWPDEATRRAALELYGGWGALCTHLPASGPELLGFGKQFKASFRAYACEDRRLELPSAPVAGELTE